jgi:alkylation response protein AidB-like acyl-CoA dehydrogenase
MTGRWMFGSGCDHCDWLAAGCLTTDRDGVVGWRILLAPRDAYEIEDTWYTTGLHGTGSKHYSCTDLFVPEEHSFDLLGPAQRDGVLWRRPDALLRKMAGVPLGVAADALDTAVATLAGKTDRITQLPYRAMPRIQSAVAENHARLAAARSYVFSALEAQWTKLERNEPLTATERADVWLSRTNAFQTARQVVGDLYDAIGGAAVYTNEGPFDRHLRDLQTACQHVVGQTRGWEDVGGLLLGNATTHPLL